MKRISAFSVILAVAVFIASGLGFALTPGPTLAGDEIGPPWAQGTALLTSISPGDPGQMSGQAAPIDLAAMFLRPDNSALWLLLLLVWAALLVHAGRVGRKEQLAMRAEAAGPAAGLSDPETGGGTAAGPAAAGPPTPQALATRIRGENALSEHAALNLALVLGAIWPWVSADHPVTGFLLAAAMFALALAAVLRGQRDGNRIRHPQTIGLFAGWATAVTYAAFATLLSRHLGIPAVAATATALLLCAGAGIVVQLRLGGTFSYSVAIIWSLVGLATATMTSNPTIATVAILGVSAMAIVLVRAAS